jgi:hypothetical protein
VPGWFDDAIAYGATPALVALGVLAAVACAMRGEWREGALLGLNFWLAAGLLNLAVATTWSAIGGIAVVIAIREVVKRAIARTDRLRADARTP